MIRSAFGLLLLLISLGGYIRLITRKLRIQPEFCLSFVFSCGIVLLFIGGIIGVLVPFALCFLGGGIACWIYLAAFAYRNDRKSFFTDIKSDLKPGILFFYVMTIFLFIRLYNSVIYDFDNFTHWAVVVKQMMIESRFPNDTDPLVIFQTYPLGSAVWIWYVCKVIGFTEGIEVFAQSFLLLGFTCSLFAFAKKKSSLFILIIVALIVVAGDQYLDNNLFSLHVDTLIAVITLAAFSIVLFYREDDKSIYRFSFPVLMLLTIVKTSAFLFVTAVCIYALIETKGIRNKLRNLLLMIGFPGLLTLIWNLHTRFVYANIGDLTRNTAGMTTHEISLERFSGIWNSRTAIENKEIINRYIDALFSYKNLMLYVFMLALVVFIVISLKKYTIPQYGRILIFTTCLYIAFFAGLLLIYLFSMQTDEALRLSAFNRYKLTMDFFVTGVIFIQVVRVNEQSENKLTGPVGIVSCLTVLALHLSGVMTYFLPKDRYDTDIMKDHFKEICEKANLPLNQNSRCLVYYSGFDTEYSKVYMYYVSRYYLWSSHVALCTKDTIADIDPDTLNSFDYLIVADKDEYILAATEDADTNNLHIIYGD